MWKNLDQNQQPSNVRLVLMCCLPEWGWISAQEKPLTAPLSSYCWVVDLPNGSMKLVTRLFAVQRHSVIWSVRYSWAVCYLKASVAWSINYCLTDLIIRLISRYIQYPGWIFVPFQYQTKDLLRGTEFGVIASQLSFRVLHLNLSCTCKILEEWSSPCRMMVSNPPSLSGRYITTFTIYPLDSLCQ